MLSLKPGPARPHRRGRVRRRSRLRHRSAAFRLVAGGAQQLQVAPMVGSAFGFGMMRSALRCRYSIHISQPRQCPSCSPYRLCFWCGISGRCSTPASAADSAAAPKQPRRPRRNRLVPAFKPGRHPRHSKTGASTRPARNRRKTGRPALGHHLPSPS